jgi:hypothetical protein
MIPREVADWSPNPEEVYRTSELREILINFLQELRPILRTVFVLRDIEGLSIEQAAEVLSLTPAAVKARLWRARLDLRELLSRNFSKQRACSNRAGPDTACLPSSVRTSGGMRKAVLKRKAAAMSNA